MLMKAERKMFQLHLRSESIPRDGVFSECSLPSETKVLNCDREEIQLGTVLRVCQGLTNPLVLPSPTVTFLYVTVSSTTS